MWFKRFHARFAWIKFATSGMISILRPGLNCCPFAGDISNLVSCMTVVVLWLKFHRNLVPRHNNGQKDTVYPKKYAHGFCFVVLCCGYTLTDYPISIRLTSLALWQSNDCPSASKATLMNMDKYFMWINYERLHNHNKAKHNKNVCIFLGIYCTIGSDNGMALPLSEPMMA